MAESTYHQAGEQHIRLRQQLEGLHPPRVEHQSPTPGDRNPWAAEAGLEAYLSQHQQQALVAIQDLEHQRVQMWSQDSGENPPR
jgi:hypothetical protein